jgi:hypothetical protein
MRPDMAENGGLRSAHPPYISTAPTSPPPPHRGGAELPPAGVNAIGPSMYGFILRKSDARDAKYPIYSFQNDLEEYIRSKIFNRVSNRKISIQPSQMDSSILQFKELGLLMFEDKEEEDGRVFRGVTLTELGERRLTRLSMRLRE